MTGEPEESPGPDGPLYARMRWNTPLAVDHADLLLERLDLGPGQAIADLGCGWGELLLRAVARAGAGATGTGIDNDPDPRTLERGRTEAAQRGLAVGFIDGDAAAWHGPADRVLCTGSSHAFGGTTDALEALASVVPPGGRLLFGDGFWTQSPSPESVEIFGEEMGTLADLLDTCRTAGWRVIHFSETDQREWDDFESTHRAGRQEWLVANPGHPRAAEIRDWLNMREREYVTVYRGVLGFAYLVLTR